MNNFQFSKLINNIQYFINNYLIIYQFFILNYIDKYIILCIYLFNIGKKNNEI